MHGAINLIWKISVATEMALAIRLLWQGLAGEYPALFTACVVLPVKSILLMLSYWSLDVRYARQIAQNLGALDGLIGAWIVYELFSRWTTSYKGIGRFGNLLLAALVIGSVALSSVTYSQEWKALDFVTDFRIYFILHRLVFTVLGMFVAGMWLFFRCFPVAMPPNVVRHTYIAMFYFVANAAAEFLYNMIGHNFTEWTNVAIVCTTTLSFGAWAVLLNKRGEVMPPQQVVSLEDRDRVQRINDDLLDLMGGISKPKVP